MTAVKSVKTSWAKPMLRRFPLTDQIKAEVLAQSGKPGAGEQGRHSASRNGH